mgnify:CR=1 FL=1
MSKPKGGMAFITDFEKKEMLSIGHGTAPANAEEVGKDKVPVVAAAVAKKP